MNNMLKFSGCSGLHEDPFPVKEFKIPFTSVPGKFTNTLPGYEA
jgi:hypothetical protein